MSVVHSSSDLKEACKIVFGIEHDLPTNFLYHSLQLSGLKSAYRQRIKECHPDLFQSVQIDNTILEEKTKRLNEAFEKLKKFILARDQKNRFKNFTKNIHWNSSQNYYTGRIPQTILPFGRYLYFAGIVSFQSLINAITWQRRQRPPLGQLARNAGLISDREITHILKIKKPREKFGACAIRLGYLSERQLQILLRKQQLLQPKIGSYFVKNGLISHEQLKKLLRDHILHNWMVTSIKNSKKTR
ncbi:MAG: J domain-containing protein [Syntrophales bacterium]|nr:J domain-containing protein [Syntrophales bacterium]